MADTILDVQALRTSFPGPDGPLHAVDGVSFQVAAGEVVGIVGESGSGKTMTALSLLRLVPRPGRITGGRIMFREQDVRAMSPERLRGFRGRHVAMVFQDPMTSLNPVFSIGNQIAEAMRLHRAIPPREHGGRVVELLRSVGIVAPERRARDYPHQFSGGMRQRAMIAMGIANRPELLIADEPTTALDVTVQAQIAGLLRELNRELGTAVLLITHNVALVARLCDRMIVMYAGRIVEQGSVRAVFARPAHPYTAALLRSIPGLAGAGLAGPVTAGPVTAGPGLAGGRGGRLASIPGQPPQPGEIDVGCRFQPRCTVAIARCRAAEPTLDAIAADGHSVRCFVPVGGA